VCNRWQQRKTAYLQLVDSLIAPTTTQIGDMDDLTVSPVRESCAMKRGGEPMEDKIERSVNRLSH
jgi:hypothetical protein